MEKNIAPASKGSLIASWIISGLLIVFYAWDSISKIMMHPMSVDGTVKLGWPASSVPGIGIALLLSTILYTIPKTAVIGSILLTGYLGGAIATMIRSGQPMYFAVVFALLTWIGLGLRDQRVKSFLF